MVVQQFSGILHGFAWFCILLHLGKVALRLWFSFKKILSQMIALAS